MSAFDDYLKAESLGERRSALAQMGRGKREGGWMPWWHVLALLPDVQERAQLVTSVPISLQPNPSWKIVGDLLIDPEPEVSGAAINSLANFQIKSLGHFLKNAIQLHGSSQRVLYCCIRYSEEAFDDLVLDDVFKQLSPQHADAFLARCFWTALKQFKVDKTLIHVAMAILEEAQGSLNLERKSIVAAVLYMLFAGSSEIVEETFRLASHSLNTETRWLIGQFKINWKNKMKLGFADKALYLMEAFDSPEPVVLGYGSWGEAEKQEVLNALVEKVAKTKNQDGVGAIKALIKLGSHHHKIFISQSPVWGFQGQGPEAATAWQQWCQLAHPADPVFIEGILGTARGQRWFIDNPHKSLASLVRCGVEDLKRFQKMAIQPLVSQDLLTSHVQLGLSLRGEPGAPPPFSIPSVQGEKLAQDVWSCEWGPPDWTPDHNQMDACLLALIHSISTSLVKENISPEHFIYRCKACLTILLSKGYSNRCVVSKKVLNQLKATVEQVSQALTMIGFDFKGKSHISPSEEEAVGEQEEPAEVSPVGEQNPLQLAFALIWVLLSVEKVPIEIEKVLQSSLRWATHIEKRWVVKALCKIDSEDAIKTVLYFALHHVDSLFVLFTVKELLNSTQSRAHQALIRLVGKKNVNDDVKFLILEEIPMGHADAVLSALKSLQGNQLSEQLEDAVKEAIGRAIGLVQNPGVENKYSNHLKDSSLDTDSRLRIYLKGYDNLSVEVKSALRTSEMIFVQSQSWVKEAVDLSPIVNMQFKAVELVMRESFEPYTDALIRKGMVSKKLDSLGYGRPIPEKMQHFEDYLAELPIINSIPYFSKFKLRKMLRAICTYRPGKRFTLDGPKAFALFFLVVSREHCPYGLAKMLPLNFSSDKGLFEYVKLVHALQDSRNRAVHEGLTWEAQEEIADLRVGCFHVIEESMGIGMALTKQQT